MSRVFAVLAILFAIVSFIAYVSDSGLSNEPLYLILFALFLTLVGDLFTDIKHNV